MRYIPKLLAAAGTLAVALAAVSYPTAASGEAPARQNTVYAVHAPKGETAQRLLAAGYDVIEQRQDDTLFVVGNEATKNRLAKDGFSATVRKQIDTQAWAPAAGADTYYGGYHTPQGIFNAMQKHIDANRSLFKVIDFGKTYTGKFPLRAYCITADAAANCKQGELKPAKGRFFLMTQTHAREIATSELALSFVNDLMRKAGSNDADVKNLLNTTEIWVLPAANPDGQEYVSSSGEPNMQRKNRNPSNGRCTGETVGVDLNRNLDSRWGTTGVSKNPCADTFPGPKANSEVETQAIIKLWQQLFPDQRGSSESDKVAADGTGYMLSIHSVAALNLFPWQGVNRKAPNDAELRAIMTTASSMNGYAAGQAPELLYSASGGHDDWIYDKLGVATGTIELGSNDDECGNGNFHPQYSCMALYERQNLPVLYYLAKIAKSPYALGTSGYVQSASLATSTLSTTVANAPRNAIVETSFTPDFASIEQVKLARANNKGVSETTSKLKFGNKPADAKVMYLRTKNTVTGAFGPTTVLSLSK